MIDPREKIALFIDGPSLYRTAKNLEIEIDFKKLLNHFKEQAYLVRAHYYSTEIEGEEHSAIRPLLDYLNYNGYMTKSKMVRAFTDEDGNRHIRGDMTVEITVGMYELAEKADHMILFTGNRDYAAIIEAVQRLGSKVTVISAFRGGIQMVSEELRKVADHFVELEALREHIERD